MKFSLCNWCTLPTSMGKFRMYDSGNEGVSFICLGDINKLTNGILFRVHSSCRASEVFGALNCDCADQLKETMKLMAIEGSGLIVYQHQEGRGHGLSLKIHAVGLMEKKGLDTAETYAYDQMPISSRSDWVTVRESVMLEGLRAKFGQHPNLRGQLIKTGPRHLVELTHQDNYWGDPGDGTGQNRLGYILMQVREEIVNALKKQNQAA